MEPKPEIPWHAWQLQGCTRYRLQLPCSPHPTKLHCAVITFAPSPCSLPLPRMHKLAAVAWHAIVAIGAGAGDGEGASVRCLLHYSLIPLASHSPLLRPCSDYPSSTRVAKRQPFTSCLAAHLQFPLSSPMPHLFLLFHHAAHAPHDSQ